MGDQASRSIILRDSDSGAGEPPPALPVDCSSSSSSPSPSPSSSSSSSSPLSPEPGPGRPRPKAGQGDPASGAATPASTAATARPVAGLCFADLPPELRDMIWQFALPGPRVFPCLVWARSSTLQMRLLERGRGVGRMPLAHVCAESRRAVRAAGYVLAFGEHDNDDDGGDDGGERRSRDWDPGVWFHPRHDVVERTLWGPGDFFMGDDAP
ncbi:hypothetical protein GGR56DRAFT_670190 [Xylariaceae sp. FL0804]|nr:hypothetical protein GGR56DRAFT_670190 [Xylariaceae sp. FL0804]